MMRASQEMQVFRWFLFFLAAFLCDAQGVPSSGCTLKSPLPAGNICGVKGHDPVYAETPQARIYVQRTQSLTECRDFVLRRSGLLGDRAGTNFRFNSANSRCYYSGKSLLSITPDSSSTTVFYNSSCFNCPPNCPQTPGVNLFDNAGFEMSPHLIAPWAVQKSLNSVSKIVRGGAYGNSARSFQTAYYGTGLSQNFARCPGVIYEYGFDYRTAPSSANNSFNSQLQLDGGFTFISIPKGSGVDAKAWRTYTNLATFDQPNNGFDYTPLYADRAIMQVDNFKLIPTTYEFKSKAGAANVFTNGGFETGSLSPWIATTSNTTVVSPGIDSNHGLQFNYPATDDGNYDFSLVQNVADGTIVPGTPYLLSIDYTSNVPELVVNLDFGTSPSLPRPDKKAYISQSSEQPYYGQNGTAQTAFVGQVDQTRIQLSFYFLGSTPASGGSILLDNILIKELAAPASASS